MTLLNMMLQATTNLGAFAAPLGAAIAVIGAGLGIGKIGSSAMEAIGLTQIGRASCRERV